MTKMYRANGLLVVSLICLLATGLCLDIFEWEREPQNRAEILGNDVVLPCQGKVISDTSVMVVSLKHRWFLDGEQLPRKSLPFVNNSLFIPTLEPGDLGEYSCVVSLELVFVNGSTSSHVMRSEALVIEAFLDEFFIHPENQTVRLREKVVLTCVTGRSAPNVEVFWMKDGAKFTSGRTLKASFGDYDSTGLTVQTSMRLEFTASMDAAGVYQCVARNSLLNEDIYSNAANVSLDVSPSEAKPEIIWDLPASIIVSEGKDLVLSCSITPSTQPATSEWFVGRNRVDESGRVYALPNGSLAFLPVASGDGGNYSCHAYNSEGASQSPIILIEVAYLQTQFLTDPKDTFAIYGDNVILHCDPPGSVPMAKVVWYKDYKALDLSSSKVKVIDNDLHLQSVEQMDKGVYFCIAVNNYTIPSSRSSASAKLTVEGPPIMKQPPLSSSMSKGSLIYLFCSVDADPVPETKWYFDGTELKQEKRISIVERGQKLHINDAGKEWEGKYTCVAKNKYGQTSATATIKVLVPSTSTKPLGNLTTRVGDTYTIQCPIGGDPLPEIEWFHNNTLIDAKSPKLLGMFIGSTNLTLSPVIPQMMGTYKCVGTNELGKAVSMGTLDVQDLPHFTIKPQDKRVLIGSSVNLSCEVVGNPPTSISWTYNSTLPLHSTISVNLNGTLLTIPQLDWSTVGLYTCRGENTVGITHASALVKILIPPTLKIIQQPTSPVSKGSKVTLTCTAEGIPAPTISWKYRGVTVVPSLDGRVRLPHSGVLVFETGLPLDTGIYACIASSVSGVERRDTLLTVYGVPLPPVLVRAVTLSAQSVYLVYSWSKGNEHLPNPDSFTVTYRQMSKEDSKQFPEKIPFNRTRIEVTGLSPGTEYVFTVTAHNDVGPSEPSNPLTQSTFQAAPSAPINLHTIRITASIVTLRWEGPATPNGVVKMYQLRYRRVDSVHLEDFESVNITDLTYPSVDYTIVSLRSYAKYAAQVRAGTLDKTNQVQWGDFTSELQFRTDMSTPSLAPQNVEVTALDPYTLNVTWEHLPFIAQNGPMRFYHLDYANTDNQLIKTVTLNISISHFVIRGLQPWRNYSVILTAENVMGLGPKSKPVIQQTLPIAPVQFPSDLKAEANSSSSVVLTWKPIPYERSTCQVTAHKIRFRLLGTDAWSSVTHLINATLLAEYRYRLSQLDPWSDYEVEVAAFTNTTDPGMGPFSNPVTVKTLQGACGPVMSLDYEPDTLHIFVTWRAPEQIRGVLQGYSIVYFPVIKGENSTADPIQLHVDEPQVDLRPLTPMTQYNISVFGVNGAGQGFPLTFRARTLPAQEDDVVTSSQVTAAVTLDLLEVGNSTMSSIESGPIRQNLAAIVAGSIVGGIVLIIFVTFVCIKCAKYRRKKRLDYDYSSVLPGVISNDRVHLDAEARYSTADGMQSPSQDSPYTAAEVHHSSRQSEITKSSPPPVQYSSPTSLPTNHPFTTHHSALESPPNDEDVADGVVLRKKADVRSHKTNGQNDVYSDSNKDSQRSKKSEGSPSKRITLPRLSLKDYSKLDEDGGEAEIKANGGQGIENPGYMSATQSFVSSYNEDTISVTSETLKRRNRMRSESAAAIAVLRNSQLVTVPDTDGLVDGEITSEVVFNERTVL